MKKTMLVAICFMIAGFAAGAAVMRYHPGPASSDHTATAKPEKKILYYKDPMHPWYTSDKPGIAPDCGMDLVPVYEGEEDAKGIRIDPSIVQNIGVTTQDVARKTLTKTIRTSGIVEADETRLYTVTTKFPGWAETLHADTTGRLVRKNQPLLTVYSPDLVSAQEEYLTALKYRKAMTTSTLPEAKKDGMDMVDSVARRLKNWDIPDREIRALSSRGTVKRTLTLVSPANGIIMEKPVVAGQAVNPGEPLYKIADLSRVWVTADIYPSDLAWIRTGESADVALSYQPGTSFKGKVSFIYPYLNTDTRTAKVRIELANTPDYTLKPGMFATVRIDSPIRENTLAVPEQAVIRSGTRDVAVIALGGGSFEPRTIKTGATADGYIQVLDGIHEGEKIVTSAQFLIDSESNLRAAIASMAKPSPTAEAAADTLKAKDPAMPATEPASALSGKNETDTASMAPAPKGTVYTCEMHPQIRSDKPGRCPICGMFLTPVKGSAGNAPDATVKTAPKAETPKPADQHGHVEYTCEMHPEIVSDKPGRCPICGMFLVPKKSPDTSRKQPAKTPDSGMIDSLRSLFGPAEASAETLTKTDTHTTTYTCPMHPQVKSDKPGSCPDCGMNLVPVKNDGKTSPAGKKKNTAVKYTCPMHPKVVSDKPGSCPVCGMNLEPVKKTGEGKPVPHTAPKKDTSDESDRFHPVHAIAHAALQWLIPEASADTLKKTDAHAAYTCPMHPQVKSDKPGSCPICGMNLVPVKHDGKTPPAGTKKSTAVKYTCPMHPQVISDKPGSCPVCGMTLEQVKKPDSHPASKKDSTDANKYLHPIRSYANAISLFLMPEASADTLKKTDSHDATCPMHPTVKCDKSGRCHHCDLNLVPEKPVNGKKTGHTEASKAVYTCEMHPKVVSDKPGSCPVCGMTLIEKK